MGKNGVTVNGILHTPSSAPQQLYTQDFLQVGEQKFFFLLPKGTSRRRPPSASPPAYVSLAFIQTHLHVLLVRSATRLSHCGLKCHFSWLYA